MCVDTRKAVMAVEPNFFQYSRDVDLNMSSSGCVYIYIYVYVYIFIYIWRFPKMEVPLNHLCSRDF